MNAGPYPIQRVSVLPPNAKWREGTGRLDQPMGALALASAVLGLWSAGPAPPDGCLSATEEMLWKVWALAGAAVVPSWATTCRAWSLFSSQLHPLPEGPPLQGFLSQPQASAFSPEQACLEAAPLTQEKLNLSFSFLMISPLLY